MKKKHTLRNVIIVLVILGIIGAATGGKKSNTSTTSDSATTTVAQKAETEPTTEAIEYVAYTIDEMVTDLKANAMTASDKYKGQYIEVTGKLSTIDSSGKYISLLPDEDFALTGIMCYIKTDEQKEAIKKMTKGDTVTLRGKCKDVGEVMGYSLDIDSIN